jgi:hypothetical protein
MKLTFLILFAAVSATAGVTGRECRPHIIFEDSSLSGVRCYVQTDDVGTFTVDVFESETLKMRLNPDGSVVASDLLAIKTAVDLEQAGKHLLLRQESQSASLLEAKRKAAIESLNQALATAVAAQPAVAEEGVEALNVP